MVSAEQFDLVILDLMLPGRSGLQVLSTLRKRGLVTPVLILTARDAIEDRVQGLDGGADDYLVKPFAFPELSARVRALLRRCRTEQVVRLKVADLEMDLVARKVKRGGKDVEFTLREFELLEYLLKHKEQVVSREMLAREVWKETSRATPLDNVIDIHMNSEFRTMDSSPARLTAEFAETRTRIRCSPLVLGINSPRGSIVKRNAQLCRCSTTQDRYWNFLADVCRRQNLLNALYSFEWPTLEFDEDIAQKYSSPVCRTTRFHVDDDQATRQFRFQLAAQRLRDRDRLHCKTQIWAGDVSLFKQLIDHTIDGTRRNGDSSATRHSAGVDSNHLAFGVDQRPTRKTGIDLKIQPYVLVDLAACPGSPWST